MLIGQPFLLNSAHPLVVLKRELGLLGIGARDGEPRTQVTQFHQYRHAAGDQLCGTGSWRARERPAGYRGRGLPPSAAGREVAAAHGIDVAAGPLGKQRDGRSPGARASGALLQRIYREPGPVTRIEQVVFTQYHSVTRVVEHESNRARPALTCEQA